MLSAHDRGLGPAWLRRVRGLGLRNTLIYWLLILASVSIALSFSLAWYFVPMVYVGLFVLVEVACFSGVPLWSENERVRNLYNVVFMFLPDRGQHTPSADLSEGYFKGNYRGTSAEQAMRNKYDAIYDWLKLAPGQRVMDLGCGHGQWMMYLKGKGVTATGVTLSTQQYRYLTAQGFDVHLGDFTALPPRYDGGYDAITAIGSFEHVPKTWMSHDDATRYVEAILTGHRKLFKPDSPNKRYFMSVLSGNRRYSLRWFDYLNCYLIERNCSGFYFFDREYRHMFERTGGFALEAMADLTEDYRYISIINDAHFGNLKVGSHLTMRAAWYFGAMILYDPYWWHRYLYVVMKSWMWQLGGTSPEVIPPDIPRPAMLSWYVFPDLDRPDAHPGASATHLQTARVSA